MRLTATDLHIWHIQLGDEQTLLSEDFPRLPSSIEQQRLEGFSHPKLRQLYLKTRWATRCILARYLNSQARDVALITTALGKPVLAAGAHALDLCFNLSHSGEKALLAVTLGNDVGIDLEQFTDRPHPLRLAKRYFTPEVVAQLETLNEATQQKELLNLWTQYEAYKKAQGVGLRGGEGKLPLNMQLTANQLYPFPDENGNASGWLVTQLCLQKGYHGAVVIKANHLHYQIRHLQANSEDIMGAATAL